VRAAARRALHSLRSRFSDTVGGLSVDPGSEGRLSVAEDE
jgi:hypothetical protein